MTVARRVAAAAVALGLALGVAWLSQAPTAHARPDEALVRLSWRSLGVRVEECRPLTEEELSQLAPHMRTSETCTGGGVDYELRMSLAGQEVLRDTVAPGGARRDRPVYVFREVPVGPGSHEVAVAFSALVPDGYEPGAQPVDFSWEGEVEVGPAEIALITLDPSGSRLVRGPR